jgi:hypothetical protein
LRSDLAASASGLGGWIGLWGIYVNTKAVFDRL